MDTGEPGGSSTDLVVTDPSQSVDDLKKEMRAAEQANLKVKEMNLGTEDDPRIFTFRKPKLKDRNRVSRIWKLLASSTSNYGGVQKVMEERGITDLKEFAKISQTEFSVEELTTILGPQASGEANMMDFSDVMEDVLFCTIEKAPFEFKTPMELSENLDWDDALVLTVNGFHWITDTVLSVAQRKNLLRPSSQQPEE